MTGWNSQTPLGADIAPNSGGLTKSDGTAIPVNPTGGSCMLALSPSFNSDRQYLGNRIVSHSFNYSAGAQWTIGYDLLTAYITGASPSGMIGSFTAAAPIGGTFQAIDTWDSSTRWSAGYATYDSSGNQSGVWTAFDNLLENHWYRQTTVVDYVSHSIVSTSMMDLTTGLSTTVLAPSGTRLIGTGAQGALLLGSAGYDAMAFDNIALNLTTNAPEPAGFLLAGMGLVCLTVFKRR